MNPTAIQNFLNQFISLWIRPEVINRQNKSQLPANFSLDKAQVIFTVDGRKIVRLNNEIKAVIKTNKRIINDMNLCTFSDQESIERLDRIEEEENFAHTTIVRIRDLWTIAFDFRHGIGNSRQYFNLGLEFLDLAKYALKEQNYQAAVTNLFIGMEHLMRARIILYPDVIARKTKKHSGIAGSVNIHAKQTKIIKPDYAKKFNFLKDLYDRGVRYVPNLKLDIEEINKCFDIAQKLSKEILPLYEQKLIYK